MSETCRGHLWEKIIVKLFASSWYIFLTYIYDARSHLHHNFLSLYFHNREGNKLLQGVIYRHVFVSSVLDEDVEFEPRPLHFRWNSPWYPLHIRLRGPQNRSQRCGRRNPVPVTKFETWFLDVERMLWSLRWLSYPGYSQIITHTLRSFYSTLTIKVHI